jgi:oxalate decarboxylase/phosphoglucose isomerase-like protein (cupin superfamily)
VTSMTDLANLIPPAAAAQLPNRQFELVHEDDRRAIYELALDDATSPTGVMRYSVLKIKVGGLTLGRHFHVHPDYDCTETFILVAGAINLRTRAGQDDQVFASRHEAPGVIVMPPGITHELVPDGAAVLVAITAWPYVDKGPDANTHASPLPPLDAA